jgi:hypothetical protein
MTDNLAAHMLTSHVDGCIRSNFLIPRVLRLLQMDLHAQTLFSYTAAGMALEWMPFHDLREVRCSKYRICTCLFGELSQKEGKKRGKAFSLSLGKERLRVRFRD